MSSIETKQSLEKKIAECGFWNHLGIKLIKIEEGYVEASLELKEEYTQHHGVAHGGLLTTLADSVAGYAGVSVTDSEKNVLTVELKMSFLRTARGKILYGKGRVIKSGKLLHFCEAEVFCERELVAKASATLAIL